MLERSRHVPLRPLAWDPDDVSNAIQEIVCDALDHFDRERFWPAHPREDGVADGNTTLYCGAAGVIWALEYLARIGATGTRHDFRPVLPRLMDASRAEFAQQAYSNHGSLLLGDMGTALVAVRVDPSPAIADAIYARANANTALPIRELMWGMPGSMLACIFMSEATGESRWRAMYEVQAARLLDQLEETDDGPLWTQDLYGSHRRWLGAVHGYAGNMIPLVRGWAWLTDAQRARVADAIPRTPVPQCLAQRAGNNVARDGCQPSATQPLPALPRRTRHGDNLRGCALCGTGARRAPARGRRFRLAGRPAGEGAWPLSWHGG
jgi:hypothetical protein